MDYYRGLLEFSNRCIKNCNYCGIRRDNGEVERFDTSREDILAMARWCYEQQYGSVTLQSGERQDEAFIDFVEGLLRDIKSIGNGALGITLCVGSRQRKPISDGTTQGRTGTCCGLKAAIRSYMPRCILRMGIIIGTCARPVWIHWRKSAIRWEPV